MTVEASTIQNRAKPNEAIFKVALQSGGAADHRKLPQVHYGFDKSKFREHARENWESLGGEGGLPSIERLQSSLLPEFRIHSALISLTGNGSGFHVAYLGLAVAEMSCIGNRSDIHELIDAPASSILRELPRLCEHVGRSLKPVEFENMPAIGPNGETVYNGILLPFSGMRADDLHIFAVLDCEDQSEEDRGVLDLTSEYFAEGAADTLELQLEQIIAEAVLEVAVEPDLAGNSQSSLAEALTTARKFADHAKAVERRSHHALYLAIGKAYDFALQAESSPRELELLFQDSGIAVQKRAPMTPIVKLVFGKDFDRTRVTEYAAVLGYANEINVPEGGLVTFLEGASGGIKGVVAEARRIRRGDKQRAVTRRDVRPATARKLRTICTRPLEEARLGEHEFGLVLVRQLDDGRVVMVGPVSDDAQMIERFGKKLAVEPESSEMPTMSVGR